MDEQLRPYGVKVNSAQCARLEQFTHNHGVRFFGVSVVCGVCVSVSCCLDSSQHRCFEMCVNIWVVEASSLRCMCTHGPRPHMLSLSATCSGFLSPTPPPNMAVPCPPSLGINTLKRKLYTLSKEECASIASTRFVAQRRVQSDVEINFAPTTKFSSYCARYQSGVHAMGAIAKASAKVKRVASSSESSCRVEPRRVRSEVEIGCVSLCVNSACAQSPKNSVSPLMGQAAQTAPPTNVCFARSPYAPIMCGFEIAGACIQWLLLPGLENGLRRQPHSQHLDAHLDDNMELACSTVFYMEASRSNARKQLVPYTSSWCWSRLYLGNVEQVAWTAAANETARVEPSRVVKSHTSDRPTLKNISVERVAESNTSWKVMFGIPGREVGRRAKKAAVTNHKVEGGGLVLLIER